MDAFQGAERKGWRACQSGLPLSADPYYHNDTSITGSGVQQHARLNWRRAFSNAWRKGWRRAQKSPNKTWYNLDAG